MRGYGTKLIKENADNIASELNVAKNAITSSSGDESEYAPSKQAVDGNLETRWSSEFKDDAWITVNFGKKYKINKVKIN